MARILVSQMRELLKERNTTHEPAESTYTVFSDANGVRYFQVDMYGSTSRRHPGKISQSIQLSQEDAAQLVELLKKTMHVG